MNKQRDSRNSIPQKNIFCIFYLILLSLFYSCDNKDQSLFYENVVIEDEFSYSIKIPRLIIKNKKNYIEINNFKSEFDEKENRYGIIYFLIQEQIVTEDVFKIDKQTKFKYYADELFNEKFLIPDSLLENKTGVHKLTVIILDIDLKKDIENQIDQNIDISYIESREYYDVFIE